MFKLNKTYKSKNNKNLYIIYQTKENNDYLVYCQVFPTRGFILIDSFADTKTGKGVLITGGESLTRFLKNKGVEIEE